MNFNWKLHLALLPVYVLVLGTLCFVFGLAYCGLVQFGFWGPVVGLVALWFVVGLMYGIAHL